MVVLVMALLVSGYTPAPGQKSRHYDDGNWYKYSGES